MSQADYATAFLCTGVTSMAVALSAWRGPFVLPALLVLVLCHASWLPAVQSREPVGLGFALPCVAAPRACPTAFTTLRQRSRVRMAADTSGVATRVVLQPPLLGKAQLEQYVRANVLVRTLRAELPHVLERPLNDDLFAENVTMGGSILGGTVASGRMEVASLFLGLRRLQSLSRQGLVLRVKTLEADVTVPAGASFPASNLEAEVRVQLEWLSISQIAAQLSQLPEVVVRQLETALRTSRDLELSIGVRLGIDDTGRLSSLLIHQVRTSAGTLYQALSVCTCMLETPDACKAGAAQRRHCPGAGVCPMAAHRCVPEPQVPTNAGSRFAPLRCGLCGACARCCRRSCSLRTAAVDKSCVVSGCKGLGCAERREFGTLAGGGHRQGVADDWKRRGRSLFSGQFFGSSDRSRLAGV